MQTDIQFLKRSVLSQQPTALKSQTDFQDVSTSQAEPNKKPSERKQMTALDSQKKQRTQQQANLKPAKAEKESP